MFSTYAINNDLKYVDEKIRNYYELGNFLSDEEIKEIDKLAENVEIEPPKPKDERKRRSRNAETVDEPAEEQQQTEHKQRKSREQVQAENSSKLANAGIEESGDAEEVPFDEVKTPELEAPPRRRRRRTE